RGNGESLYYASEERKVKVSVDDTTQILSPDPSLADTSLAIQPSDTTLVKDSTILEYSDLEVDSMAVKPDTIVKSNLSSATDSVFIREQIYIGVNKSICSNIAIYLTDNQVQRIVFLNKPDGVFYPLEKFPQDEYFYDGFSWQEHRRPLKRSDIFVKEESVLPESEPTEELSRE